MESSLSNCSFEICPAFLYAINPETDSPKDPIEKFKKLRYSFMERLQYPSAIFRCTESVAAICWDAIRFNSYGKDRKTSQVNE